MKLISLLAITFSFVYSGELESDCRVSRSDTSEIVQRIWVEKGKKNTKKEVLNFSSPGNFLTATILPFPYMNDSANSCLKEIMQAFDIQIPIDQHRKGQIEWIIKNSFQRQPSEWMDEFDTTFQPFCSIISQSVFETFGEKYSSWIREYYSTKLALPNESYGMLVCYLAQNHNLRPTSDLLGVPIKDSPIKIPLANGLMLVRTSHGVYLEKGKLSRWVYFDDEVYKLRHPSIEKVVIDSGAIFIQLSDSTERNNPKPFSIRSLE